MILAFRNPLKRHEAVAKKVVDMWTYISTDNEEVKVV